MAVTFFLFIGLKFAASTHECPVQSNIMPGDGHLKLNKPGCNDLNILKLSVRGVLSDNLI